MPQDKRTSPLLVAHRGYPSRYPENTLVGIQAAVAAGAKWFEFDVQLSKDHVPFLCHDDSLERTAGLRQRIMDLSSAELATVDVGETPRFYNRYIGTPPTPLNALIAWLKTQPGISAFVEVKAESLEHFGRDIVIDNVMKAVGPAISQCVIISFDSPCLIMARQRGAGPVGWALEDIGPKAVNTALAFKPEYLFVGDRRFTQAHAAFQGPWRWAVYQTQDPRRALQLTEQGAYMVETDAIGDMLSALGLR